MVQATVGWFFRLWWAYASGMAQFFRANDAKLSFTARLRGSAQCLYQETRELAAELRSCRDCLYADGISSRRLMLAAVAAAGEVGDVWHCLIKLLWLVVWPKAWLDTPAMWMPLFVLAGVATPIKHALRFLDHGCIRNRHHCCARDRDHACVGSQRAS